MSAPLVKTSTPGVYRRGSRYVYVYRDPNGRQCKRSTRTLSEARAARSAALADIRRGEYRALSNISFSDYASTWIDTYGGRTRRGITDTTRADYRRVVERELIPFFGARRLAEIEPIDIKRFAQRLGGRGLARNTVRLALAPLKALLATAVEEGLIRSNPAAGLRNLLPMPPSGAVDEPPKALTEEELARLLDAIPPDWRLFFEFLAHTGLRIGEAVEVRWGDLDFGERRLHVQRAFYNGGVSLPKGRKARRIRLTQGMATQLWARRKVTRGKDSDLVFPADRGGRIVQTNLTRRALKPAAWRAGVGWVTFHTFRHTCATILFRRGWNIVQVQKFLGHADSTTTMRVYVHLLDEDLPEPDFMDAVARTPDSMAATRTSTVRDAAIALGAENRTSGVPTTGSDTTTPSSYRL
jgi:integrase